MLGNLLLQVADGTLLAETGTNLEMEMVARVALVQPHEPGATTVPARKFFDICRRLLKAPEIAVQLEGERMLVRSKDGHHFRCLPCQRRICRTSMTGRVKSWCPSRRQR
ncbi:hypothetical protein ACNKHL_22535 [Shigella flexneri]